MKLREVLNVIRDDEFIQIEGSTSIVFCNDVGLIETTQLDKDKLEPYLDSEVKNISTFKDDWEDIVLIIEIKENN